MIRRSRGYLMPAFLLVCAALAGTAQAQVEFGHANQFLARNNLGHVSAQLSADEMASLNKALSIRGRRLEDHRLAKLLNNPNAWQPGKLRGLLGTIIKSLPSVATIPGVNKTMELASLPNDANFRGFGTELISAAGLGSYVAPDGRQARVCRMGGMINCADGKQRESDGAAFIGADKMPRLVTIKSVSSIKAVPRAMKKAGDQLALRNYHSDGTRTPGVIMVGYDSPDVYNALKNRNWQSSANRTGANVLVLGVNQLNGKIEKLAQLNPDPKASNAKRPGQPRAGTALHLRAGAGFPKPLSTPQFGETGFSGSRQRAPRWRAHRRTPSRTSSRTSLQRSWR